MKLHFKPSEQPRSYTVHQWQCDPLRLSATGEKLRVKHYTAVPNITRTVGVQPPELTQAQILHTDYTSYSLGGRVIMKGSKWDKILFDGGYCQATQAGSSSDSFAFYYYNHDHLGNIREVVDASGTVQQVTNYYPFGTPYCDSPSAQSPDLQPYKYNGKELDRMHGLDTYDYGARQYDPVLCRWDRMDPLCEKYYGISPYAYCANNPVNRIDPNGCDSLYWGQDGVLIGCFGNDKNQTYNYVIKTTFTTDEVYANNNNQRGWCNPISNEKYDETVKEIQAGNYSSPNIVFVGTTKRGENMLNVIEDDGKGGSTPQNNREYFGTFNGDEVENIGKSNIGIIGSVRPVSKRRGKIDFHSHPSGRQEILVNGQMKGAHWIQPPSAQDISTAKGTEYVIGVGYDLIYRYDKDGINAIFPSMIFK